MSYLPLNFEYTNRPPVDTCADQNLTYLFFIFSFLCKKNKTVHVSVLSSVLVCWGFWSVCVVVLLFFPLTDRLGFPMPALLNVKFCSAIFLREVRCSEKNYS